MEADTAELEKRLLTSANILNRFVYALIWITGALIMISHLGFEAGPLLGLLGIVGVAVGVGSQSLIKDLVNGFFIIAENQVRKGDVASLNGTFGVVEEVNLRTIVLRDVGGAVHIFSNGSIKSLSNLTKEWSGYVFDIGVALKEDVDRVIEVIKQVGESILEDPEMGPKLISPVEVFGLDRVTPSGMIVKGRLRTLPHQHRAAGREFLRRIKRYFDAEGIEIPFPHMTLYCGSESGPYEVRLKDGGSDNGERKEKPDERDKEPGT